MRHAPLVFLSFVFIVSFFSLDQLTVLRSHRVVIDSAGDRDSSMAKCKMQNATSIGLFLPNTLFGTC